MHEAGSFNQISLAYVLDQLKVRAFKTCFDFFVLLKIDTVAQELNWHLNFNRLRTVDIYLIDHVINFMKNLKSDWLVRMKSLK